MQRQVSAIPLAAACLCLLVPAAAPAQTPIQHADFDATFPGFGYSYDYSGVGAPDFSGIDTSDQTSSSYDVLTSPAATATMDSSQWMIPPDATYTYAGWGLGIGFVLPGDMTLTSGNLANYSVTFDVSVTGYDEFDDGLNTDILVILQSPDDDDPDTDAEGYTIGANGGNLGNLLQLPLLTTTPQTVTLNLADLAFFGSDYDFPSAFAQTNTLILQLQPSVNAAEIGIDSDNVMTVDNVRFDGPFTQGLAGDFDGDGDIDGRDFLVWQRGGSPTPLSAGDLTDWQTNYGVGPLVSSTSVPEPASALLLLGVCGAMAMAYGRNC